MNCDNHRPWTHIFSIVVLLLVLQGAQPSTVTRFQAKQNGVGSRPTPSRRDVISGFNRENLVDSREEYLLDTSSLGNQIANQEDPSVRSVAGGQQSIYMPAAEIDESASPLGEAQQPTVAAPDYKIAYSDGLPYPSHPPRTQENLLVYDTPQDPLDESDSNTVKIADPSASKKLFSSEGFSHGMGELSNAINTLLIDKVLNSDNDKDFNKELKLLSDEFAKDDEEEKNEGSRKQAEGIKQTAGKKQQCQPSAKSIFANCKKKRSAVCSPEDQNTFYKNSLNIHNLFRKIHGVPDIEMNDRLSKDAQDYADHLAKTASSVHSLRKDRPGQGENIAVGCTSAGSELRAKEAISQWYSKACQNEFDFNGYRKGVEPFAQVVWRATAFLGMGKAVSNRDGNLCTYIVARYSPEGDKNSFAENVLKGTFSRNGICGSSCIVKGDIIHSEAPKAGQTDKMKFSDQAEAMPTISGVAEEKLKGEKLGEVKQGEVEHRKTPVQPEIKKVENKNPNFEDDIIHNAQGSTKIRANNDPDKMAGQAQKPQTTVGGRLQADVQNAAIETSVPSHGLLKSPSNNIKMITDEEFAAANSHQKDQSNASLPQKGSLNQEGSEGRDKDGNAKDGMKVTSKAPAPKVPMLINITFPQQLQTRNNSMIQITVGGDGPVKPNLPEQGGFKTVVNFSGRSDHVATSEEEFFDKEDRNGKEHEGDVNAHALTFVGDNSVPHSQPAVGYGLNDFSFDTLKQFNAYPSAAKGATVQNASLEEADNLREPAHNTERQHMFQDRKGMDSKNRDNSVTYLKIATKLMHDKDTTDDIDYFIPKQLGGESTSGFARERNDYGFTDQTSDDDNSNGRNSQVKPSNRVKLRKEGRKKKIGNVPSRGSNENLKNSWEHHQGGNKLIKGKNSSKKNKWNKENKESKEIKENKVVGDYKDNKDEKSVDENGIKGKENKEQMNKDHRNNEYENKDTESEDNKDMDLKNKDNQTGDYQNKDIENEDNKDMDIKNKDNQTGDYQNKDIENEDNKDIDIKNKDNQTGELPYSAQSHNWQGSSAHVSSDGDYSASKTEGFNLNSESKEVNMHGYHSTLKVSSRKVKPKAFKEKTITSKEAKGSKFVSNEGDYQKEIAQRISHLSQPTLNSDAGKLSIGNENNPQGKNPLVFSPKPKQFVKSPLSNGHWMKSNSYSGFTAHLQEAEMKGDRVANGQKYIPESNIGKGNFNNFAADGAKTTDQNRFQPGTGLVKPQGNRRQHTKSHETEASVIANHASSSESSFSPLHSSIHQPSQGGKYHDLSDWSDNRKFMKSMDSEIVDHRVEKQKQVHGKVESNKVSNLEFMLSKQVNGFHKMLGNEQMASNLAEKGGNFSMDNKMDDRKGMGSDKQGVDKERGEEAFMHSNGTDPSSHGHESFDTENGVAKFTGEGHWSYGGLKGQTDNFPKENIHPDDFTNKWQYQLHNQSAKGILTKGNLTNGNETANVNQAEAVKEHGEMNVLLGINKNTNAASENEILNKTGELTSVSKQTDASSRTETHREMDANSTVGFPNNYTSSNYSSENSNTNILHGNFFSDKNQSISPAVVGEDKNITEQEEAVNATTINVGTGFIKIKYEKTSVVNPVLGNPQFGENNHMIHRESPTAFAKNSDSLYPAFKTRGPEGVTKGLEKDDQSEYTSKFGNIVNEKLSNNSGYNRIIPFQGDGNIYNNSNEPSFSPVINKKDRHHFVIQITPTNSVAGEKKSVGGTGKVGNGVSSFNHYKEDPEFEDVSTLKHVPRLKFKNSTIDDNDIAEDLMSDNIRAMRKDEDVQAYMKNNYRGEGIGIGGNANKQEVTFAQPSFNHERQQLYASLNQKPLTRPYDLPLKQKGPNSRKFPSGHLAAAENVFSKEEHRAAQGGESGRNKTAVSSSVYLNDREHDSSSSVEDAALQSGQAKGVPGFNGKQVGDTMNKQTWMGSGTTEGDIHKQNSKFNFESAEKQALGHVATSKSPSLADAGSDIFHANHGSGSSRLFAKYDTSDIITNDNQNSYEDVKASSFGDEKTVDKKLHHKEDKVNWNSVKTADRLEGNMAPNEHLESKHLKSMQSAQMINDKKLFSSIESILKQEKIKDVHSKGDLADFAEKALTGLSVSSSQNSYKAVKSGDEEDEGSGKSKQKSSKNGSYNDAKGDGIAENIPSSSKPVCKSNCESLPLRHISSNREDESNVIGLNLQSGYDRFSGFHKVYDNEDLTSRKIGVHSESPAFLSDSSIGHGRSGHALIFIPDEAIREFQREMTRQHNKYRRIHDAPYLHLDSQLSKDSQTYAKELARKGSIAHSSPMNRPETGESIEKLCSYNEGMPSASQVLKKWYNEVCDPGYIFTRDGKQSGTGHFTQVVWKKTTSLGIGLAASKELDGRICSYVVARYFKAGNDLATIRSNVARGSFHSCNKPDENTRPTVRNIKNYSMSPRKHVKSTQRYKSGKHHTPTHGYKYFTNRPSHFSYHSNRNQAYVDAQAGGFNSFGSGKNVNLFAGKVSQWHGSAGNEWKTTGNMGIRGDHSKTGKIKGNHVDNFRYSPSQPFVKAYASAGRSEHSNKNIERFPTDGFKLMKSLPKYGHQSIHSDSFTHKTFTNGQGNLHTYRENDSLNLDRYASGDSGDEFYLGNPQKNVLFQSQLNSKNGDNAMQSGSKGSMHHLGMPDENRKPLLPTMKSFNGKQKAVPSTSFAHSLNKPTVAHRFATPKHKQFAAVSRRPNVQSKQGSLLFSEWSKAKEKSKGEEPLSPVTSQMHESTLEEHQSNENGSVTPSQVTFVGKQSQFTQGKDHSKEESYSGHNNVNHFHSNTQNFQDKDVDVQNEGPPHDSSQQPPVHSHEKASLKTDSSYSMKTDSGFLNGMNAALAMGNSAESRDFYDQSKGLIDSSRAYTGIGNVQDLRDVDVNGGLNERGVGIDNQIDLNSLREEGEKIEESLSDVGTKSSDQSFEEGLIKSVNQGRVDVSFEKRPEDYKMPSLLMDEYRYNTPENGKGTDIYEGYSQELGEKMGKIASHARYTNASNKPSKGRETMRNAHQKQTQETIHGRLKLEKPVVKFTHQHTSNDHLVSEMEGRTGKAPTDYALHGDRLNEKGNKEKEISFITSDQSGEHGSVPPNANKPLKPLLGFQSGFEDALSVMNSYDDGKVMDVTATKKEILSRAPTQKNERDELEKSYDTSRTRHFVIDKSNNLVLTPGEETGPIADYESKHLGDLAHEATYGVKNVAKMFKGDDLTAINSLQKIIPDQNDLRSGLIAWSGPYNPGLPNEEEIKQQSDISGQDLVEKLEKPNDFKISPMLNEKSSESVLHPADNFGNIIVKNDPLATETGDGVFKNYSFNGDILSKFHNEFKNGSGLDDGLSQRGEGKEKKFVKFQGKIFDDDMKLLTEKNLEEDTSSTPRTTKEDIETFRQNALMWHNKVRCVHYADRLRLNETLSKEADDYANEIVTKNNGILDHSKLESRKDEGENLAMTCHANRATLTGAEATFKWYSDICDKGYDFRSDIVQKGTGHFSQLVWQKTTDFGIGRAMLKKNGRFCTVIVARYFPKGNIKKEFTENVKQGGYSDRTCENLARELNKKTDLGECDLKGEKNKQLGKFIEDDVNHAIKNAGKVKMIKPVNMTKEREKARLNYEIRKVTDIINRLEKDGSSKTSAKNLAEDMSHAGELVASENAISVGFHGLGKQSDKGAVKGDNGAITTGAKVGFSDLGGTGSPVIVYHGVTGFFENPKTFTNIGVETHNKLRKIHGAPELKLDVGLTMEAFKYATFLTQLGYLQHDKDLPKDQGENLAIGCFDNNSEMSAEDAVSRWYYEVCQPGYNFKNKIAESGTGHFTQVIWKSSKKIGIAKQTRMHGNMKCTYIVARYSPAGNIHGEFEKNVEKGGFNDSVCRELMRDLLKFQQRNEKLVPHLEQGLKQAQAEAKVQEKIMALMHMKAMEKQNKNKGQKEGEKPKGTKDGEKSKDTKVSKAKGFFNLVTGLGGKLQSGFKQNGKLAKPKNERLYVKQSSTTNSVHNLAKQQPHIIAGVLNNGLRTIVEDNHKLLHIGPTVKIVESDGGGGLIYRKIEGPSVARGTVADSRKSPVRYHSGHSRIGLMRNGHVIKKVTHKESNEFDNPMNLVGTHEKSPQNPLKTTHAIGASQQRGLPLKSFSNEMWYSSPHLTSSTFDPVTGRIVEKDFENLNSFVKGASLSHWTTGMSGNLQTNWKQQQSLPKLTNKNVVNAHKTNAVGIPVHSSGNSKSMANKMLAKKKPSNLNERYKAPKVVSVHKFHTWLPSRRIVKLKAPEQLVQPHSMPASLMRILHGKSASGGFLPFAMHPQIIAKHTQEHKLPNSLLRILKGKSKNTASYVYKPSVVVHPVVHETQHRLPASLLRMINARSKALKKNPVAGKSTAPHKLEHAEHQIPASLQRILQAKKANGPTPSQLAEKYWTEKPYSIMLDGHKVPYSLFKMLTANAVSGKAPRVAKYLTEKPFTIVENQREIPESLKRILSGRLKSANLNALRHVGGKKVAKLGRTKAAVVDTAKDISYDSEAENPGVGDRVGTGDRGWQKYQKSSYPRVESYGQRGPIQRELTVMFAKAPQPYKQSKKQLYSAAIPTPVVGTARAIVAGKFPEKLATTTAAVKGAAPTGIKGPSLANFEAFNGASDTKPMLTSPVYSHGLKSYSPLGSATSNGQLVYLDQEKDREEFERTSLESHNLHRRMHGVGPLKLDYKMSIEAEQYARKIAQSGRLDHSGTDDGENIASVCRKGNSLMTGIEATNIWYKEVCEPGYDFKSTEPGGSGHFTQVVWKGSTELGVGRAEAMHDGLLCTYVVARYRPAGNFIGEFAKNVLKGKFNAGQCILTTKKSTIANAHKTRAMVSRSVKRSRVQRPEYAQTSRKTLVDFGGVQDGKPHEMTIDDAIIDRANSVWLSDLESGLRGSDLAGMIPLGIEAGYEKKLKKQANKTMEEPAEEDEPLSVDAAAKLHEQVEKILDERTAHGKTKTGVDAPSKNDIDASRVGFQNMEDSFKKSKPTLPPGIGEKEGAVGSSLHDKYRANSRPMGIVSGKARSGENPLTLDMAAQVGQAVQQLQSAAQSVSSVASPNLPNNIANMAVMGSKDGSSNSEMGRLEGGSSFQIGNNAAQLSQDSSAAGAPNPPINGVQSNNGQLGGLASSNMAADDQQALSKAAEDKQKASEGYKPTEFEQSGLNVHNKYRSVHDAPPLVLNQGLSKDAEAWAKQCATLGMPRRSPSTDGENVIESCKPARQELTASEAVETWYSELCSPGYEFDAAEIIGSERFTQMIWKGTTEMGIGRAKSVKADLLCTYIVARYRPSGNVLGDVKGNVLRGSLDSKHFCEQFMDAARMSGKNRILDNLPVKSERMEEAASVGSTLHAGKAQPEEEITAGGDDPGVDGASQNKKDFRLEALYNHNRFRSIHNAPPLQLDVKKCQEAEDLAASLAAKGSLMRAKSNIDGQNIAMSCNKDGIEMSGDEATNKWYNEVCNPGYDFKGPYAFGAAHFMQVVWVSSKKFGIGKATTTLDNMLCTWVVALYEPSGVMKGMEKENVLLGLFDYRYCDTFGKGGGGKGASSGVIHKMVDSKVAAPNAAGQPAGKRSLRLRISSSSRSHEDLITDKAGPLYAAQELMESSRGGDSPRELRTKKGFHEKSYNTFTGLTKNNSVLLSTKRNSKKHHRTRHNRRKHRRFKKHKSHRRNRSHRKHHARLRHHHHHNRSRYRKTQHKHRS